LLKTVKEELRFRNCTLKRIKTHPQDSRRQARTAIDVQKFPPMLGQPRSPKNIDLRSYLWYAKLEY
ncbi:hypothetical protein, partial [Candidatus Hakubella thermalkaliphila]|uniref:hypothetical protein n=1 Tax=Candidatus Hakubella thermalkaliphila TaxID=2754717 RepID=UPI001C611D4E